MKDFKEIISGSKPTLVDFFATWCGPCKMQSPVLDLVKQDVGDEANVIKIDVDADPELSALYRVQSVPTLIIFKNGDPVWRASGLHHREQLVDKIREFVDK